MSDVVRAVTNFQVVYFGTLGTVLVHRIWEWAQWKQHQGLKERGEQYKKSMVGYMILKPVHRWYWGLLQENTGKVQVSIGKSLTERMSREAPSLPPRAASVQILWFIKARQGKGGHYQKAAQHRSSSSLSTSSIFTIHGLMLQKGLTIIFLDNVIHSGGKFCLGQRECLNFFLVTIFLSCSFW